MVIDFRKVVLITFFYILIMSTTCFAAVNYMPDDYADRLYNRLQSNYAYYVDNLNNTNITNKFDLFSGDDLQEFYNTNETIQNFINESVTVESFAEVFYAMSSDTVSLYIFYCNDDNNPIINPSYIYNQFQFNNIPCIKIRIDTSGNLIVSSASITSQNFTSNDVGEYFYHENYANQQAVRNDIIIENDTITKAANYIPFIFNGEDLEFPYTKVQYNSEYYRLAQPLENGYINPPAFNNSNIIGTIISSGDDYIIDATISGEDDFLNFLIGDADFNNEQINSGDIIGSIGYTPPDDPYVNFWWELTNILNNALTDTKRTLILESVTDTYTISIDDIGWNPSEDLRNFLTLISTTCVCILLAKFIKITIDKLQSGSIDDILAMNEETGIVDLF